MTLAELDQQIAGVMARAGVPALRISLAIIFIWFGWEVLIGGTVRRVR